MQSLSLQRAFSHSSPGVPGRSPNHLGITAVSAIGRYSFKLLMVGFLGREIIVADLRHGGTMALDRAGLRVL